MIVNKLCLEAQIQSDSCAIVRTCFPSCRLWYKGYTGIRSTSHAWLGIVRPGLYAPYLTGPWLTSIKRPRCPQSPFALPGGLRAALLRLFMEHTLTSVGLPPE